MIHAPRVQKDNIIATDLDIEFDVSVGSEYPENIVVYLDISAMSEGETLDLYGQPPGLSDYSDTILTTQVDLKTDESTVKRIMLKAADVGPLDKLKLIGSAGITDAENVAVTVISW